METRKYKQLQYVVRFPQGYEAGKQYPVILFFHGAGLRGTDITPMYGNKFFEITAKYDPFDFICVAPLCEGDCWFDVFEQVKEFADFIYSEPYTDKSAFYGMGNSMGGYATWQLAMSKPEMFSAIVPICGGGMYWNVGRLKNVPVWAFHGELDLTVLPRESEVLVERLNKCGGNAKLTVFKGVDHGSWIPTYENKEVFEWLLSNKKEKKE